ncbi:hypothetical protein HYDPIDRAFT_176905 [Hydnomerulius pinastri MD-312]|uniref:Uncharacterized protein n=1 Tax=Hydnomerulius pinastri MD-312 TaxID=994086 RepID=A0A0C9VUP6_9AGAM|nr:hypothetical protein HYDPIDRAFT_176905 [Hydnomerulius pinastri MD-312]
MAHSRRLVTLPAQYELDDIHTEYHPHSSLPSVTKCFSDFSREHFVMPPPPDLDRDPWHPFRCRLDFEVAELALEAALTKDQTSRLIKLLQRVAYKREKFSLKDYKDLRQTWDAVGHRVTPFQKELISVPYRDEPEPRTFNMWHRPLWGWACDLLKDPRVGPHFVFDAQRLSKFNGRSFVHFIDEPWTAGDFWDFQSQIPPDGKLLAFILYADKAKLSSFGREKGYPVVARCANLPTAIRNGEGFGGGRVVGWLPIVKEDKKQAGKPAWVNFKNAVWHESFKKLLETIASHSKTGCWVKCWDDVARWFFPLILILSADYEEQCVMTLIRGVMSKFPCPVCLIPREELSKSALSGPFERRTRENVIKTLKEAREQHRADEKEAILIAQGLCDVDNSLNTVERTDSHRATSWDRLHADHEGFYGDHLWVELQTLLNECGRAVVATVNENFAVMPRWRSLNHFDEVVDISFSDGSKHEDISKLIVFACHGILTEDNNKIGYLLLRCIRAYLEFDMYTALETTKGVTRNYNTKPNEKMHGPLKQSYQQRTNYKNVAQQILNVDHCQLTAQWLRCKIEDYDAYMKSQGDGGLEEEVEDLGQEFFHVRLGAAEKPETFEVIELSHTGDRAFERFRIKLNDFLNAHFAAVGKELPGGKRINLNAKYEIIENRYIKVNYESMVDWCQRTDYLRTATYSAVSSSSSGVG